MRMIRKPVVSGMFYPDNPSLLRKQIEQYLDDVELGQDFEDILGVISPHAGYIYSGRCAAYSFKALSQAKFDLGVILAPSHHSAGYRFSVGDFDAYETPLGAIPVDKEMTRQLMQFDHFEFHPEAHEREHSLEVQLPFLQVIRPDVRIVPLIVSSQQLKNSAYLADTLYEVFRDELDHTVFIASSDLSHYHSGDMARIMDGKFAEMVEKNQPDALYDSIRSGASEACGFGTILALMHLSNRTGHSKVKNLKYMHSGDVSGDDLRVVGYLSTVFSR